MQKQLIVLALLGVTAAQESMMMPPPSVEGAQEAYDMMMNLSDKEIVMGVADGKIPLDPSTLPPEMQESFKEGEALFETYQELLMTDPENEKLPELEEEIANMIRDMIKYQFEMLRKSMESIPIPEQFQNMTMNGTNMTFNYNDTFYTQMDMNGSFNLNMTYNDSMNFNMTMDDGDIKYTYNGTDGYVNYTNYDGDYSYEYQDNKTSIKTEGGDKGFMIEGTLMNTNISVTVPDNKEGEYGQLIQETKLSDVDGQWWQHYTSSMKEDSLLMEMRVKFNEYFNYGVDIWGADGDLDEPVCATDSDCGDNGYLTKCCSKVVMYHPATKTKDVSYTCINKGILPGNINMRLGDFNVEMQCLERSAASQLIAGALAATSLAALTLF